MSYNFMAVVTIYSDFGVQENKICLRFHFCPFYLPWSDGTGCHDLSFWMLSFKPAFSPSSRGSLVPLYFLPLEWYHLPVWGCWYFSWWSSVQLVISPAWHFTWCTLHRSLISRVTIYSLVIRLSQFWTSHLCHIQLGSHLKIFRNYPYCQLKWLNKEKWKRNLLSRIWLFATPWTV